MKTLTHKIKTYLFTAAALAACILSSCNAKEEESDTDNYLAAESVAISSFSLSPDLRVMENLDSVFFSIDLEHGVVFNADSLPKGTNITKLIPKITYPASVTSAVIEMKGGTHRPDGTVNYNSTPNDTIDFTGEVTLTLSTAKNALSKTYILKVNVHKEDPDTVFWENFRESKLPSRSADPVAQKTIAYGNGTLSLIQEADGTFTKAVSSDIFSGMWQKTAVSFGFAPRLETLYSTVSGTLYILSDNGELFSSNNGEAWNRCTEGWIDIIGQYGEALLGVRNAGGELMQTSWPEDAVAEIALPQGFPVSGHSSPVTFTNRWTPDPTILIFGGKSAEGKISTGSWAYDGSNWANLAEKSLPGLDGLSVINYYSFLNNASNGLLKEFEVLLAIGGRYGDGSVNNTIYVSYDHGINWSKALDYMQLPEGITAGYMADALALTTRMESDLSDRWSPVKGSPRRVNFKIEGDYIIWDCPYIFIFGGYGNDGKLTESIRTGVLRRLTFVPLF